MVWKEAWLGTGIDCVECGCVMVVIHMKFVVNCYSLLLLHQLTFCCSKEFCLLQYLRSEYSYILNISYSNLIKHLRTKVNLWVTETERKVAEGEAIEYVIECSKNN
jgi:hypothetical protein